MSVVLPWVAGGPAATATTVVRGENDPSVSFEIDPSGAPSDPLVSANGEELMYLDLPASRTITRVTIGDLARADGCTQDSYVRLYIAEYRNGGYRSHFGSVQVAHASAFVRLGSSLARATFIVPPTRLAAGGSYVFAIGTDSSLGCSFIKRRTWAHNALTVNPGPHRCGFAWGTDKRMWHVQGQDDRDPVCHEDRHIDKWDPSMPTGWLVSSYYPGVGGGYYVWSETRGYDPPPHECGFRDFDTYQQWGIEPVFWRLRAFGASTVRDYVCKYTQYAPFGQTVPDGWYYSPHPVFERNSAARDMYLKLEYNPDDDFVSVPDCVSLLYSECVSRLESAGFTRYRRVDVPGIEIHAGFGPNGVVRTNPPTGTVAAKSTEIAVRTNPSSPQYTTELAKALRPQMLFDSSERFRPLNVDTFFAETLSASEPHRVCRQGPIPFLPSCTAVDSADDLLSAPSPHSDLTLDIAGTGDDDTSPRSPFPECHADGLLDCDTGDRSAIYYHAVPDPPSSGYLYLDYWFFYRYNEFPDVSQVPVVGIEADHEADWEGVTVAPSRRRAGTFDFVFFSQHGTWYGYLRENLTCDNQNQGSCGTEANPSGYQPSVFVAAGSHANYPDACQSLPPARICDQAGTIYADTGHDGAEPWGRNWDDPGTTLLEFGAASNCSSGVENGWVDWTGLWGVERTVRGPACQPHYQSPGQTDIACSEGNDGCPREGSTLAAAPETRAAATPTRAGQCRAWFGARVGAIACDRDRLARAVRKGTVGDRDTLTVTVNGKEAAEGRGITQLLGDPLRPATVFQSLGPATRPSYE